MLLSHLAKYRSLLPSLALLFHLIDGVDTGRRGPVSGAAAAQAAAWCEYLAAHARRSLLPSPRPWPFCFSPCLSPSTRSGKRANCHGSAS